MKYLIVLLSILSICKSLYAGNVVSKKDATGIPIVDIQGLKCEDIMSTVIRQKEIYAIFHDFSKKQQDRGLVVFSPDLCTRGSKAVGFFVLDSNLEECLIGSLCANPQKMSGVKVYHAYSDGDLKDIDRAVMEASMQEDHPRDPKVLVINSEDYSCSELIGHISSQEKTIVSYPNLLTTFNSDWRSEAEVAHNADLCAEKQRSQFAQVELAPVQVKTAHGTRCTINACNYRNEGNGNDDGGNDDGGNDDGGNDDGGNDDGGNDDGGNDDGGNDDGGNDDGGNDDGGNDDGGNDDGGNDDGGNDDGGNDDGGNDDGGNDDGGNDDRGNDDGGGNDNPGICD